MHMEMLVYTPLLEGEVVEGCDKSTINFLLENRSKALNLIRDAAMTVYKDRLQNADAEEIYSETLMALYRGTDYQGDSALAESGDVLSLTDYIYMYLIHCTIRKLTGNRDSAHAHSGEQ